MSTLKHHSNKSLTRSKKILFGIILISLPLLFIATLEIGLRIFDYGYNYDLFIKLPDKKHKVANPDNGKKYFSRISTSLPHYDPFLVQKPDSCFRVFVMGSSTVYGFPYESNLSFPRILENRLQDIYPNKRIEVVNTSITAINSFTLRDYIPAVLREEPDAILFYAGHNEFYGAFGMGSVEKANNNPVLTNLHLKLLQFRFYQLLRNITTSMMRFFTENNAPPSTKGSLMQLIAGNKEIAYKSETYNKAHELFKKNLDKILSKAAEKDIPVFIGTVVSNTKDLPPFCSVETGEYPKANDIYRFAQENLNNEEYRLAKTNFTQAKDYDCIRFRASEDVNEIIQQLARKHNAHLLDLKTQYFEKNSPHGIVGNNLLTEHVHPNISGYFLMADGFFDALVSEQIIANSYDTLNYKNTAYYRNNWGYTELDSLIGVHKVNSLTNNWPFVPLDSSVANYFDTYQPVSMVDSMAFQFAGSGSGNIRKPHLQLAEHYRNNNMYFKAYKEYLSAIYANPHFIRDYLEAARCLMYINDFSLAEELFKKSMEIRPTYFAHFNLAEIMFLQDNYAMAVEHLDKALKVEEATGEMHLDVLKKLHKIYHYWGNEKKMQVTLQKIHDAEPEYNKTFRSKKKDYVYLIPNQVKEKVDTALSLYESGKFDPALDVFLQSLQTKETSLANRCVGDIYFSKGDLDKAMFYYEKAYPDYRQNVDFVTNLTILYVQHEAKEKAEKGLQRIKQLHPEHEIIPVLEKRIKALGK